MEVDAAPAAAALVSVVDRRVSGFDSGALRLLHT